MKYRKRPVVIDAWKIPSPDDFEGFGSFAMSLLLEGAVDWQVLDETGVIGIETLEGLMVGRPGDWVIRGVKGEFYPCRADIFELTYEAA